MALSRLVILGLCLAVTACGGGGGSSTTATITTTSSPTATTSSTTTSSAITSSATSVIEMSQSSSSLSVSSPGASSLSSSSATISSSSAATSSPTVSLSGSISYDDVAVTAENGIDYNHIQVRPVRGAVIQLKDEQGFVIKKTTTDSQGKYSLVAPLNQQVSLSVVASLKDDYSEFNVRDNLTASESNRDYTATSIYSYPLLPLNQLTSAITNADFHAQLKWNTDTQAYDEGRTAPVFALLDQAYELRTYLQSWNATFPLPALEIFWNEHNKAISGVWWLGEIPNSAYSGRGQHGVMIASTDGINTDEYDRTLVAHEFGHYVLSVLGRDDTIGGSHSLQASMDMRQAFAEGFASYISASLTKSDRMINTKGAANSLSESASFFSHGIDILDKGWFNEVVITNVLHNIDQGNNSYALPAKGYKFILSVIREGMKKSDAYFSIHNFLGNAVKLDNTLAAALQNFTTSVGITSIDEWAAGETYQVPEQLTNNGLNHTYLPIYEEFDLGVPKQVCMDDKIPGGGNRLGSRRYLKLTLSEKAFYRLHWSATAPANIFSDNHTSTNSSSYGLAGLALNTQPGSSDAHEVAAGVWAFNLGFNGNEFPGNDARVESGCITVTVTKEP